MKQSRQWWLLVTATALVISSAAVAQPTVIRQVIGSGAVASISPTHAIGATIGQTIIGRSTSSTHSASLGFWYTYPFSGTTGVRTENVATGATAAVRVAPNPAVSSTRIMVALPRSGAIELGLYDRLGRERTRLIDGWRESGTTTVELPVRDLESGDYMLVLVADGERTSTPLRVIK